MLDLAPHPPATEPADPHVGGPLSWTAAGLLVAAGALVAVSLLPEYFAGTHLHQADQVVQALVVAAGWVACGVAVADRRAGHVGLGAAAALALAAVDLGGRIVDLGQLSTVSSGPGVWLHLVGWAAGTGGAVVATVVGVRAGTLRAPGLRGARSPAGASWTALTVVAGVVAAVAFVFAWDRFVVVATTTAPGTVLSLRSGYAFDRANPGGVIAGNAVTMVALAVVPLLAALWRPVRAGAAALLGVGVVLTAQVVSAAVQVMETPNPLQVLSATDVARYRPQVSLHLTGWYDVELAALLVLLVIGAARLHEHPAHPVAVASPDGLGPDAGDTVGVAHGGHGDTVVDGIAGPVGAPADPWRTPTPPPDDAVDAATTAWGTPAPPAHDTPPGPVA